MMTLNLFSTIIVGSTTFLDAQLYTGEVLIRGTSSPKGTMQTQSEKEEDSDAPLFAKLGGFKS